MDHFLCYALCTIILTSFLGYHPPGTPSRDGQLEEKDILPKLYVFTVPLLEQMMKSVSDFTSSPTS